jgi:hypothetical protein
MRETSSVGGPSRQAGDAIENTLFHLLGRQGRCLTDDFLEAGDAEQGLCVRP